MKKQILLMIPEHYCVVLLAAMKEGFIAVIIPKENIAKEIWKTGKIIIIRPLNETVTILDGRNHSNTKKYFEFGKSPVNVKNICWITGKASCGGEILEVLYVI